MASEIQEAELSESLDQSIQMQQLLPLELRREHIEYSVADDINPIIPCTPLRMRNVACLSNEQCANAIANHLQSSDKFMQDSRKSELFRMETVRTLPQCLPVKRCVKSQLVATVKRRTVKKSISCWKLFKYNVSLKFTKIWVTIQNFFLTMELWHRTIKTIESHHGSGIATYFKFLRWLLFLNTISCILSVSFIVVPQALDQTHGPNNIEVMDFLTGGGFLPRTVMYYGFYSNGTVGAYGTTYSIPLAYFLTLLSCYIVTFVILSLKVISSYRKSYVETSGKIHNLYSSKIFCGWDFNISSSKTAALQSASIYKELEELLAETKQHVRLHWCAKCLLIIVKFVVTSIVIFMICGAGALVWMLLSHYGLIEEPVTISVMIVPIVITTIIYIFPTIIYYLASLERRNNKRMEVYVTIVRNYAVAATIIGTLFVFWIINSASHCWQTHLGEEIYRLIILDFIALLFVTGLHFTRSILYKRFSIKIDRPEFDIACNTLNLIYNQALFWMGFYFSPLISVIIVIKLIFTFYVKRYELKRYFQRPSEPWRAAQTQTLFLALAFLSIIAVLFTLGYIMTNVKGDKCGPFRNHAHTWDFIVDGILSLERNSPFWSFISKLVNPAIGAAILIGMCIAVHCVRAKSEASKEIMQILSGMLLLHSQDKQFLLKSFDKCAKNKRIPVPNEINFAQNVGFVEQNRGNEEVLLSR